MKRWTMVFLAVLMVLASLGFSGCGGDKKETGSTAQPAREESLADLLSKGKKPAGLAYDYVMTAKDGPQMTGKMWVDGKKARSETTVQNQKMIIIIDGDANVAYMYNPDQNSAMKIALDSAKQAQTPGGYTRELDPAKAKVLETTTYDGVRCRVVQIDNQDGKGQSKMWLREDYGLPVRVESTDASGGKMVMEYKNLKVGPVPADTFQLPSGVKITDIGGMMKQMPAKP